MAKDYYGEKTVLLNYKVPISKAKDFDKRNKEYLLNIRNKHQKSKQQNCDCYLEGNILKRGKVKCTKTKSEHKF